MNKTKKPNKAKLTDKADVLLCALYGEYLNRGKEDNPCVFGGGAREIHSTLMPKWAFEDVSESCRELAQAGYLFTYSTNNIAMYVQLKDSAVAYNGKRFPNGISDVLERLGES